MYKKYRKYKTKVAQLKNSPQLSIVRLITHGTFDTILEMLPTALDNTQYCDQLLGSGVVGKVISIGVGNSFTLRLNKRLVQIPVVVKLDTIQNDGFFQMEIINDTLYIYAYNNATTEIIILSYLNLMWLKELTPHLPLMVGFSICNQVRRIITEQQGLTAPIEIPQNYFISDGLQIITPNYAPIVSTRLVTLGDLFQWIAYQGKGNVVTLPNSLTVDIAQLWDYLLISYIHTIMLLPKIVLLDMHLENIFIHWINKFSYCGYRSLAKLTDIFYQINNQKYLKISTYGILLKLGDIGSCIYRPRSSVIVVGQLQHLNPYTIPIIEKVTSIISVIALMFKIKQRLLPSVYARTQLSKILSGPLYAQTDEIAWTTGVLPFKVLSQLPTAEQLLLQFDRYLVSKTVLNDTTLVVPCFSS